MEIAIVPVATPFTAGQLSANRFDRLPDETLREIFLTLALADIPSLRRPQGRFFQVNGVCRRWRRIALDYAELWAINAGSFTSDDMTDLMIERGHQSALGLCFDGHFEDHAGAGYVLTAYQLSLLEENCHRLRSFVHDDYRDWSAMFYRLKSFPKLEMARIWDEAGPDMWPADDLIDAPRLHRLYMNNVLIPFNAPSLVYLRVDMDNKNWSSSRNIFNSYEPEGCEAVPRVFPTREFIAVLKRSPLLERLVVTDMPLLCDENLPSASELHIGLPRLRVLHLGGKSQAMGDFLRRMRVSQDIQVFVDTDVMDGTDHCESLLKNMIQEYISSGVYDSFRISLTALHDILLQWWSSETSGALGGLDLATSLGSLPVSSQLGPEFTLRLPSVARDIIEPDTFTAIGPCQDERGNTFDSKLTRLEGRMSDMFYRRVENVLEAQYRSLYPILRWRHFSALSTIKYLDYTDAPRSFGNRETGDILGQHSDHVVGQCAATHLVANWSTLKQLVSVPMILQRHFTRVAEEVTIVNFPCASFPSQKRCDETTNREAWDWLHRVLVKRDDPKYAPLTLRLAESYSEMSEMACLDEPKYVPTIEGSYEDAVRAVTQKGYERVAPYLKSFEDLRIHAWPGCM